MDVEEQAKQGDILPAQNSLSAESTRKKLYSFFAENPSSKLVEGDQNGKKRLMIVRPWNDESVALVMPDDPESFNNLVEALNSLVLPELYSAILHQDTYDFEVIFTAFILPDVISDVAQRAFTFRYLSEEYKCEFGRSSDRLLSLASAAAQSGNSNTSYRNLFNYQPFLMLQKDPESIPFKAAIGEPISFYVRNLRLTSEALKNFVLHLNFYMTYFDSKTPELIIHNKKSSAEKFEDLPRFLMDLFPTTISARPLDDNLLHYWKAARTGDTARKFGYYYRIIEYVAAHHLDQGARTNVRRILTDPAALDNVALTTDRIITAIQSSNINETTRFKQLCKELVRPEMIWKEIQRNTSAFDCDTVFDGSYRLQAFIAKKDPSFEDFKVKGVENVAGGLRNIRNALSHGREQGKGDVILPTQRNFDLLQPWVCICAVAAGEVMMYHQTV